MGVGGGGDTGVGMPVGTEVGGRGVGVGVSVGAGVDVGVKVGVSVGTGVGVEVGVAVGMSVAVGVKEGMEVGVAVGDGRGVGEGVALGKGAQPAPTSRQRNKATTVRKNHPLLAIHHSPFAIRRLILSKSQRQRPVGDGGVDQGQHAYECLGAA